MLSTRRQAAHEYSTKLLLTLPSTTAPSPSSDDLSTFWFDNFQHGEQVEFSSFIQALTLHFNECFSTPLFVGLPLRSARPSPQPSFLPLLVNAVLFLSLPDLYNALLPSASSLVADDDARRSPFIRRHQLQLFLATFGGQLRTAVHLAHFTIMDGGGGVYAWFHGLDRSFDRESYAAEGGAQSAFLIRFSHSHPGSLSVLTVSGGVWGKRYLTCGGDGWSARQAVADGRSTLIGVYDSVHAYIAAHHTRDSAIPSPLTALYPRILSSWDAAAESARSRPPSPVPRTPESSLGDDSQSHSETDAQFVRPAAPTYQTSPSPALRSYHVLTSYPLVAGGGKGVLSLPDSPSRASTVGAASSQSPPSPLQSDASSTDVEMTSDEERATMPSSTGCPSWAVHAFFYAIAVDDVLAVEAVIRFRSVPLTAADEYGLTCVHVACAFNRVRILQLIKAVVPVTILAAVTVKTINTADDAALAEYNAANRCMPYFRTQLVLKEGSPCGSVACGYQSGGCLAFLQNWISEHGIKFTQMTHESQEELATKA